MSELRITGGNRLFGEIVISGAKNAVLPILGAAAAIDGKVRIYNSPDITDVNVCAEIIKELGGKTATENGIMDIDCKGICKTEITKYTACKMRSSVTFCGGLLGRFGEVSFPVPGGCILGDRPIDMHIEGFKALGAEVTCHENGFTARGRLRGADIALRFPSVGATQNIMTAACFAEGKTTIRNPSREPETRDLAAFLNMCGAKIQIKADRIEIYGVGALKGCAYSVIPDRIEAGTYLFGTAMAGGKVTLRGITAEELGVVYNILIKTGCNIKCGEDNVTIKSSDRILPLESITASPYPGFPTDLQPQLTAMLSLARGQSIIKETVFNGRNRHIKELNKMGANIHEDNGFVINGVPSLKGAEVCCYDLRGGAALTIAALAAKGKSVIKEPEYIFRGYEDFTRKLKSVGADIEFYP